jgi:hypothetical protein
MIARVRTLAAAAALAALCGAASAQPRKAPPPPPPAPPPPADIRVRSALTQTAAWVGDPVEFVIEIDMAPGVEVVADDLKPEKLTLEGGLELGDATSSVVARDDGWRTLQHRYRITAWDTTPPKRIGSLVVRYRRPVTTASADGSAPAAELKIAGASLPVRSTLPDDGSAGGTRDRQAAPPGPDWLEWLRPLGLGFLVLGAAPVVLWLAGLARRPRVARPRTSNRSLQQQAKGLLDELQIIDTSTPEGRRRAYDRIDEGLRAYVSQAEGIAALALTADELRPMIAASKRVRGEALCDVLAACERARYGPDDRLPDASAIGGTIVQVREALGR